MPRKLAEFIIKRKWLIIGFWVVVTALIVSLAPSLSDYTSDDQSSFLPAKYQSAEAQEIASQYFPESEGQSVLALITRNDNKDLVQADQTIVSKTAEQLSLADIDNVGSVITNPMMVSSDHRAQLIQVQLKVNPGDEAALNSVAEIRSSLAKSLEGSQLNSAVTGSLAFALDMQDSASNTEKIVGLVTVLLILLLPTIVFRSPFAGILSLVSVGIMYVLTRSLLATAAKLFDLSISGQLSTLLIVILFGIGTDYILFLLFRYREQLRAGKQAEEAVGLALHRASKAILSAALVVATVFAAMFAAQLGFFKTLAPGLVIAVLLMLLAALSLVPALLGVVREKIFWPTKMKPLPEGKLTLAGRTGRLIARRPLSVVLVVVGVLAIFVSGLGQ